MLPCRQLLVTIVSEQPTTSIIRVLFCPEDGAADSFQMSLTIFFYICGFLCLWFRASWLYINNIQQDATVCRYLFTANLLYMFRASMAPIIRSTKNCNCSLWYRSYYVTVQRPSSSVAYRPCWSKVVALLRNMTCTRGCSYSFVYSWWRVRWTPETCRVILQ